MIKKETIKCVLNENQVNGLIKYLGARPYQEVFKLMSMIEECVKAEDEEEQICSGE